MKTNANISISKTTSSREPCEYIAIDVCDAEGRKRLVRIEIGIEVYGPETSR